MKKLLDDFYYQCSFVSNMHYQEADARLSSFLDWLEGNEKTASILAELTNNDRVAEMLKKASFNTPPSASSPDDYSLLGLHFMREVKAGKSLYWISNHYGIRPPYNTNKIQDHVDEVIKRYIKPSIVYIERKLLGETAENSGSGETRLPLSEDMKQSHPSTNEIFVVHGHNNEMKEAVARTLELLGLKPIILHEMPTKGRTIIEKFVDYSSVNFAIVLLSPSH